MQAIEMDITSMDIDANDNVVHTVVITGQSPKINGYTFVASIDHTPDGNVVNVVPNKEDLLPPSARTSVNFCVHCMKSRARNTTYILANEEGACFQVGSNCLKDFTGHTDVHAFAEYSELLHQIDSEIDAYADDERGGAVKHVGLRNFLKWVALSVRTNGWVSRAKAEMLDKESTKSNAFGMEQAFKNRVSTVQPSEEIDGVMVDAALAWIRSDAVDTTSDYMYNLYTVCKSGVMDLKHAGYAASLISAYTGTMKTQLERTSDTSKHLFAEGMKPSQLLTVTRVTFSDGAYGTTAIHSFVDSDNNKYTWFQSSGNALEVGKMYNVKFTVKKNETSEKYGNVTIITRCKATL